MSVVLISIGIVVCALGLVAIGFGVPIREFGLGNTLIIAGSSGVVGGLLLIGLGAAVRELRRLALLLERAGARPPRPAEMTGRPPPSARIPFPPKPVARPSDLRGSALPADKPAADMAPPEPGERHGLVAPAHRAAEPPPPAREPPAVEPTPRPDLAHPPQWAERREREELSARSAFEEVWPPEPAPRGAPAGMPPEPRPEEHAPDSKVEPREAPAADVRPVSILKSGVIDGMAYTLYTDGSIEAQLAQGVVRFASIDELRQHLDKHG